VHRKLKKKNRKIRKKVTSAIVLTLLLTSMLTLALSIQTTEGWTGTVFIRADGSIDPPSAPISSSDNVTYALVDSILGSIIVLRDNIVLDGAGHTLQGTRVYSSIGIDLSGRKNMVIQNTHVKDFYYGIQLSESFGNSIIANEVTANDQFGVILEHSSYNVIGGNNITYNGVGIGFSDSSNHNCIYGNNITNGSQGISFGWSSANRVYRNFFIYNYQQAYIMPSGYVNFWDNGYSSDGNYWSDYDGIDENKDGFGDTPYIIDAQNADHYPLTSSAPIVDIESPILSVTNLYHGEVIRSSAVTISWEGVDYASGINHYTVAIDDEYSINVGLNTSYTFTELDNGQHVVRIAAFDNVGNTVYRLLDFTIDDRIGFAWLPYMAEAVVMVAVAIALGIALYVLTRGYFFRIRKPSRKLVR
jgi:parallel beta-helix repeat protein